MMQFYVQRAAHWETDEMKSIPRFQCHLRCLAYDDRKCISRSAWSDPARMRIVDQDRDSEILLDETSVALILEVKLMSV